MGMRTDAQIAAMQALAGIKPVRGEEAELLQEMSDAAFRLIKVIELEMSGIRDGAGFWVSSDAMEGTARRLLELINAYNDRRRWASVTSQLSNS